MEFQRAGLHMKVYPPKSFTDASKLISEEVGDVADAYYPAT